MCQSVHALWVLHYFLGRFKAAQGKLGVQLHTARCVVMQRVKMIEPCKGRVYDPCPGFGRMFVQSERFAEAREGPRDDVSRLAQEATSATCGRA